MEHMETIVVTLLTVLTSGAAWQFYSKRMRIKSEEKLQQQEDAKEGSRLYREELKERIIKLESQLERTLSDNQKCRDEILALTRDVSGLNVEVEHLRKHVKTLEEENERLKSNR